jgi:hypothetical protein
MKSMSARVTLLILFLFASAGTGYLLWKSEKELHVTDDGWRTFDASTSAAARAVLDVRAAQQAYVAAGQGEPFWIDKVAAALPNLKASIATIRAHATEPRAWTAADAAASVVEDFAQMDRRASEYARADQRLLASDLIFSDGLEMTGAAVAALDDARAAERESRDMHIRDVRRAELVALAGYAGFGLLTVLLLLPNGRKTKAERVTVSTAPSASDPIPAADVLDLSLKLDADAHIWNPPKQPVQAEPPASPSIKLDEVALVCTELARVADTRSLPSILERAASVLNASGIVLWIADPDGRELAPIVAHGYSAQLLGRMGTIARDAQNVTAAAFRTGLVQTVSADAVSNGAIAAPLLTPTGIVGVMAAEVKDKGEKQPAMLAAATIVAAQLATLVGPPSSRAQAKANAGA